MEISIDLIEMLRKLLRISSDDFDDEIKLLIQICLDDLKASGAIISDDFENDNKIKLLIILFVKSNFGIENPEKDWNYEFFIKKKAELLNIKKYVAVNADV